MATNECSRCGSTSNLWLINCRHTTVCLECAKPMAEKKESCSVCGVVFTRLLQEYPVGVSLADDKKYFAGKFNSDRRPDYAEDQWSLTKQSQSSDANAIESESLSKDPWILENSAGIKYTGNRVEPSSKHLLFLREDDGSFLAVPCADWYIFDQDRPGTQLTAEQAEDKMERYSKQADRKIQEFKRRLRTGQRKPTSTNESQDSLEKGEHWDHDSSCSDDEDVGNAESIRAPKAIRDFEDKDNEAFLSNSGRDMKNILRKVKESEKKDQEKGSGSGDPST